MSTTVSIAGLGLWAPGFPSAAAWAAGERDSAEPLPTGKALDRRNKRRAGSFGRAIADSSAEALLAAGADRSLAPIVVGSAIGEASILIGLLEQMWRTKTDMSPANFTISVHNAASGLLSISSENRGYCTSLAADENTPAVALLEGIGLVLQRQEPVLVTCCDESAPTCLVEGAATWSMLAGAVVLAPVSSAMPNLAHLDLLMGGAADLPPATEDTALISNPQIGMLDLIGAVQRKQPGKVALDRGTGHGYLAQLSF
ncbi:MAG: hypothetical protein ACI8QC_001381 [Planctomycetota bacterium]|jgi:hypothetical protein